MQQPGFLLDILYMALALALFMNILNSKDILRDTNLYLFKSYHLKWLISIALQTTYLIHFPSEIKSLKNSEQTTLEFTSSDWAVNNRYYDNRSKTIEILRK